MRKHRLRIDGDEIAVYESVGQGHPILFVHGNSTAAPTFSNQLDGRLGQQHRVVALDLPGHGDSGQPRDPESTYSLPGYARVVEGVIDALDAHDAVLVGWSLGGHVVMEAAPLLNEAAGLIVYGAPPMGKPPAMDRAFCAHPGVAAIFAAEADPELVQSLIEAYFSSESPAASSELAAMWEQTDGNSRALLGRSLGAGRYADEQEIVKGLSRPIAVLQGKHEALVQREYLESIEIPTLWRNAIQVVPDAAHAIHLENPDGFDRLVTEFVEEAVT